LSQYSMGTPQPEHNYPQPVSNQPWSQEAVRIHGYRGSMKAFLARLLALQAQAQSLDGGIHSVLKVGNQLDRQDREGFLLLISEKTGNRDALFLELREQVNGLSPVAHNLPLASLLAIDRTSRGKEREKVYLTGEKRSLAFPNAVVYVRARKLNLSAPYPGRLWAAQTFGSASLWDLVVLRRSISNLVISPDFTPSVALQISFLLPQPASG
jgi:hypothetical protein